MRKPDHSDDDSLDLWDRELREFVGEQAHEAFLKMLMHAPSDIGRRGFRWAKGLFGGGGRVVKD